MAFPYFPKLPPELRTYVWDFALPPPRIITITATSPSRTVLANAPENEYLNALYYACKDSNYTVKKHYKPSFHYQLSTAILFNPSIDTLYFPSSSALRNFYESTLHLPFHKPTHQIQKIAMYLPLLLSPQGVWYFWAKTYMDCLYDVLKSFVGLRRIVFVDAFEVEVPYEELEYTVRDFRSALYNWEEKWGLGGEGKRFLEGVMFGVVKERDLEEGLEEEE